MDLIQPRRLASFVVLIAWLHPGQTSPTGLTYFLVFSPLSVERSLPAELPGSFSEEGPGAPPCLPAVSLGPLIGRWWGLRRRAGRPLGGLRRDFAQGLAVVGRVRIHKRAVPFLPLPEWMAG